MKITSATLDMFPNILGKRIKFALFFVTFYVFATEPNPESGANVDASKMWRDDREQFNKRAEQLVRKSLDLSFEQ